MIEFHCEHCSKTIKAADEHAGKRAKCPSCHQSVYVPTPPDAIEPLTLEPLDKAFDAQREKLMRETREITSRILRDRETGADVGAARSAHPAPPSADTSTPQVDIETLVVEYALHMADGDLKSAEELAGEIRRHGPAAENVIQRLTLDEIPPPALKSIPRPVLVGFFKRLREKK